MEPMMERATELRGSLRQSARAARMERLATQRPAAQPIQAVASSSFIMRAFTTACPAWQLLKKT